MEMQMSIKQAERWLASTGTACPSLHLVYQKLMENLYYEETMRI